MAGEVQNRTKSIERIEQQIQAQIDEIYRRACADLNSVIKRKLATLQGDEAELQRQNGEITRLEQFVEYQQSGGDGTAFLFNWARHNQLKEELYTQRQQEYPSTPQEALNIKCSGQIQILSTDPAPLPLRSVNTIHSPSRAHRYNSLSHTSDSPSKASSIAVGITNRLAERKSTASPRKTSEYFAEALSSLEDFGRHDGTFLCLHETCSSLGQQATRTPSMGHRKNRIFDVHLHRRLFPHFSSYKLFLNATAVQVAQSQSGHSLTKGSWRTQRL